MPILPAPGVEPEEHPVRPITMRAYVPVLCSAVLSLGLAGCGSAGGSGDSGGAGGSGGSGAAAGSAARLFGHCRADDPSLKQAAVIAEADLGGSGAEEEIGYLPSSAAGPCANALLTTSDGEPSAMSLGGAALDRRSVQVVQLAGTGRQLLLVHERSHPRGGYPVHLYGAAHGELGEVLADGEPVVAFVATDGGMAPATATCTRNGGIATVTATTHEPPGIVLAWDVRQTTYTLDGNDAQQTSTRQIRDAAADPLLRKEMPQLFEPEAYFADCIVP